MFRTILDRIGFYTIGAMLRAMTEPVEAADWAEMEDYYRKLDARS